MFMYGEFGQTTAHVYKFEDKIGTGASCNVFKGVEKCTGQTRALKIFKDSTWNKSPEKQREISALSRLRHRNIIGYYGTEIEMQTGNYVLVMEYCSGGSLQSFLQEPEHIHGLRDAEFLTFLNDTCKGCRYLRLHGFVHRDIKPGNILRHVHLDGSVVYKLADFGASKSVELNGGEFMSLAGTEEYLHPAMYEQAFIRQGLQSVFSESADTWSLGVTIYHASTGEVPFKPFRGARLNREAMYMMITNKPPGIIAGEQIASSSHSVQWRRRLPVTCPLSQTIKENAECIISGLIEADTARQWTFDTLEDSVQKLVSLKRVSVVNTGDSQLYRVYVSPTASLVQLKKAIAVATEISEPRQVLILQREILEDQTVNPCVGTSVFASEEDDEVLTLVDREDRVDISYQSSPGPVPSSSTSTTVKDDAKTALELCSFLYLLLLQIQQMVGAQRALRDAQFCLLSHLKTALCKVEKMFKVLSETCQEKQARLEGIREMESTRTQITRQHNQNVISATHMARKILNRLHKQLWSIKTTLTSIREVVHSHSTTVCPESGDGQQECQRVIQGSFDEAKTILKRMRQRIQQIPLSVCENTIHEKDRRDLPELYQNSKSSLLNHYNNVHRPQLLMFIKMKSCYMKQLERLCEVERVLDTVKSDRSHLSDVLIEASAFSGRAWKDVVSSISKLFNKSMCQNGFNSSVNCVRDLKLSLEHNKTRLTTMMEDLPEPERFDLDL